MPFREAINVRIDVLLVSGWVELYVFACRAGFPPILSVSFSSYQKILALVSVFVLICSRSRFCTY